MFLTKQYKNIIKKMNQQLQSKAVAVLEANDQSAASFLQALLANPQQVQKCIHLIDQSQQYLFVICNMFIKNFKNGIFLTNESLEFRLTCCKLILVKTAEILLRYHEQIKKHIVETLIQLSAHALQTLLMINPNQSYNTAIFQYIGLYLNNFIPHENILDQSCFNENIEGNGKSDYFLIKNYIICSKVLNRLVIKMSEMAANDFRGFVKMIKWFTDNYLQHILSYQIKYSKMLLNIWLSSESRQNSDMTQALSISIKLLDSIISFPFSPGIVEHQFQSKLDKIAPEPLIKFPQFYHKVIYDIQFTQVIAKYLFFIIYKSPNIEMIRDEIISILRIFGRIFNSERRKTLSSRQEQLFQENNVEILMNMSRNFKFYDEYYLCSLFDLFDKAILYGSCCCEKNKISDLNFAFAEFVSKIISLGSALFTSDGVCSLPKRCFELLQYCRRRFCGEQNEVLLKISYQNIFEAFVQSIAIQPNFYHTMNELHELQDEQHCFQELSNKISSFYFSFSEKNNGRLLSMKLDINCHPQIKSFWFYFISCLFVKADRGQCQQQVSIILKFVDISKKQNIPACILFVRKLALQCMAQAIQNGKVYKNSTPLWLGIQRATNQNFTNFLQTMIQKFLSSLVFPNEITVKASLESLDKLKVHLFRGLNFFPSSTLHMIESFTQNISQTPFQDLRLSPLRKDFFSLISQIWLNSYDKQESQNLYGIYQSIKREAINQNNPIKALMNFLTDFTGLLSGLHKHLSRTFLQISYLDIKVILNKFFTQKLLPIYFSDVRFDEIFLQFVTIIIKKVQQNQDTIHYKLGIDFHELLYPYLKFYVTHNPSPKLCYIWKRMGQMNPVSLLLPLDKKMKPNVEINYEETGLYYFEFVTMIKLYFDNLHRVQKFEQLFSYTTISIACLKNWWEEAIIREEPLGIRISLPEYASSIIKNLKEKVPKNLQQKIERIGEVLYDVESNFPYLGSLNIGKGSRKVYCEQFVKIAWDIKNQ